MTFNYIKAGIWHRPIIPVTIAYKNKEIRYLALIDSGADFNVFHKDIADILRIDLSKLKQVPFSGISPGINIPQGSFAEVTLQVGKSTTKTMVLFSKDISDNGYGILGQQGFFNNFKVAFDYISKEITILQHLRQN